MYRLLLLDIDDTLYDATSLYRMAEERAFKELRRHYPLLSWDLFKEVYKRAREDVHRVLGGSASMHNRFLYFQRMMEILGLTLEPQLLIKLTDIYWNTVFRNARPFPGVIKTLRTLKEHNVRIGVVTDLLAQTQAHKLRALGVSRYVDFMVTSEETGREKPHPSMFLTALHKARMSPEEAVMVGDNLEKDVLGAKAVGITGVLFGREDPRADHSIKNFEELLGIVLEERRRFRKHAYVLINVEVLDESFGEVIEELKSSGYRVGIYGEVNPLEGSERIRELGIEGVRTFFWRRRVGRHFYEQILNITRVKPWRAMVVDDKISHLRVARHLMMKTVLWKRWEDVFIPDYFAEKPEEILEAASLLL
ncbi:MAG: HAD-IA family hydrolase [Candidatus Diapherotrites archaeon]|nr:HAD-IA family hydrolase [Candidatus Diapherotrites archaeon]